MNSVNISFQKQDLEIDRLPLLMNKLFKKIAELFLIPKELSNLKDLKWKTNNIWERDDNDLLYSDSIELGEIKFRNIQELENTEIKANLVKTFRDFLKSLFGKTFGIFPH